MSAKPGISALARIAAGPQTRRNFRFWSDLTRSPPPFGYDRYLRTPDGQSGSRRRPLALRDRAEVVCGPGKAQLILLPTACAAHTIAVRETGKYPALAGPFSPCVRCAVLMPRQACGKDSSINLGARSH